MRRVGVGEALGVVHRSAELERVATLRAKAGVNINYVYGAGPEGSLFTAVLSVTDLTRAEQVLEG